MRSGLPRTSNGCRALKCWVGDRIGDILIVRHSFTLAIEHISAYICGITDQTLGVSG